MLLRNSWFFAKKGSVSKTFPTQPLSFDTDVDYRWHENVQWCTFLGNWSRRISLNRHKQRRGYLRKIAEFVYDLVCLRYYLWITAASTPCNIKEKFTSESHVWQHVIFLLFWQSTIVCYLTSLSYLSVDESV